MQECTLGEIARHVGGRVCGDPATKISAAATLEEAGPGHISFLVNLKYEKQLETTEASAIIVGREMATSPVPLLIADDPYYAFARTVVLLHGHRTHKSVGVSPKASISDSARIGKDCHIHDFATVADDAEIGDGCQIYPCAYVGQGVRLGRNCIIYPNVVLYERCQIGNRVVINANSTIGVDGFGYATHDGVHHKIPQVGGCVIGDDVEIGSCCGVERGGLQDTVIGQGSKLGDLVTIGHGARIGAHCLLVAQVGIAGSTTLGHHCIIGGQVGIVGHITLGNNVTVGAQAGVINDVPDGETVMGAPAIGAGQARRAYTMLQHLPQMRQEIKSLKSRLKKIAAAVKTTDETKKT